MYKRDDIEFDILPAQETHAQGLVDQYIGCYGQDYPLKEFTDPARIRDAIAQSKYRWMVAVHEGQVISSAVGIPEPWNNSFEHGRATCYPKRFRGKGINHILVETLVAHCLQYHDLGWFGMRDRKGVNFAARTGLTLAGHFPGLHQVKFRENHLLYIICNDTFRKQRKAPLLTPQRCTSLVASIEEGMRLSSSPSTYPPGHIVGPAYAHRLTTSAGELSYTYEPNDESLVIGAVEGNQIKALELGIENLNERISYIQLDVLADKTQTLDLLSSKGFQACAYIPGWYLDGEDRFDCVRVARGAPSKSIDDHIDQRLALLKKQLSDDGEGPSS